jgi:hypothetical protein
VNHLQSPPQRIISRQEGSTLVCAPDMVRGYTMAGLRRNGVCFGINANQNFFEQRGVGGLFPWKEATQQPHLPSCADFFLGPKLLIFFKRNQVFQTLDSKFLQRNKADRSGWLPLSSIYFPIGRWAIAPEKLSRNYRGGGGTS